MKALDELRYYARDPETAYLIERWIAKNFTTLGGYFLVHHELEESEGREKEISYLHEKTLSKFTKELISKNIKIDEYDTNFGKRKDYSLTVFIGDTND